ncbi:MULTISPECIES: L,D-transpeptidase [Legionella]|uniref:L,D-transpeptidase n=1 Tax=Legionella septentrionalis TaxID=2498109 RepID=A0A3S0VB93_9GAMM|nr:MULTISPECIES: L,D-transpeptidase [Legionella]MCP0913475.1 L,D-transpeptidase [Legionella sp. 27cVA30]RUQ89748.1 L,D-transpeptidase [Legionella septentrionalis]RUQ99537.1 L,D-transpeptidase [Legionella septentrionalis]RUR11099.1 L,D-transpeptidase [Legionella septentrionalis]RUR14436.1 L,D-transpeptidase [Legionella septentrionalis]
MKNKLIILPFCLGTVACAPIDPSTVVVDDAGNAHHTMHYSMDSRGSNYFPEERQATGRKVFIFDPKIAAWAVYDAQGKRVRTGSASGGKDFCEDVGRPCRTVTGTFKVYSKKGEECTSSIYPIETNGGAKMPYCMHFNGGYSIHGAYEVPTYNASHGCIRVLPSAAKWLNENFMDIGTTVIVKPYH